MPSAEASPGLRERDRHGSLYRCRLPPLPSREDEAVPQGQQVRRAEVPVRVAPLPARPARPWPDQGDRVPAAASREAEGPPHLRRAGEAVPHATTKRPTASPGKTGEELLQDPRVAAGQRGLPGRLRQVPRHGPPAGQARPLHGERQEGRHPVVPGHASTTSSQVREKSARADPVRGRPGRGRQPRPCRRGWRPSPAR